MHLISISLPFKDGAGTGGGRCVSVCRAAENQLELHKGKKNKIKATRTCKARHNIPHCYHCDSFPTTHLFRFIQQSSLPNVTLMRLA